MHVIKYLLLICFSFTLIPVYSQPPAPSNPLLTHSNNPIPFDKVNAGVVRDAVNQVMQMTDAQVKIIIAGLKPGSGPGSTLAVYDQMSYELNDLAMKLGLIAQTYPSDSIRNAANEGSQALSDYQTTIILNEPLYKALKNYAAASLSSLRPNQQKYVNDQLRIFENNGMKLDSTGRKELQAISDRITMLSLEFDKNIATSRD